MLRKDVERRNDLLLEDGDLFGNQCEEHRVLAALGRIFCRRIYCLLMLGWEGILERDDQLAGLGELVGLEALVDGGRHADDLEHLVEEVFLILLPVEIAGYLAQVDVLAAERRLQLLHRLVRSLVQLPQLRQFPTLPCKDLFVRQAQMSVLLRVRVAELLPSESKLQRLQVRGCLVLLVGQLIDGHAGEPLAKLPAGLTAD